MCRGARPNAGGIEPVRLRQVPSNSVPLRAPARSYLNRETERLQAAIQLPPRCVQGGGIFERGLRLSQDTREPLGLIPEEVLNELGALLAIARLAGKRQVGHSVRAAPLAAEDMLYFQRHIRCIAVGTLVSPLFQQVFAGFVAGQLPLLVLDALNFGVLHELRVELDKFLAHGGDRTISQQTTRPGEDVGDTAQSRRRKPPLRPGSVGEAGLTVASLTEP